MINFSFKISEIANVQVFGCFLNVFENVDRFVKKRYLDSKIIPFVHVANDASKPSEKLIEIDHVEVGTYLFKTPFRRFNYSGKKEYVFNSYHQKWEHTNLLVTNTFSVDEEPLWYGHRLPLTAENISILVGNQIVESDKYKVMTEVDKSMTETKKVICHGIENERGNYFVKYEIASTIYVELLNTTRLFNLSFDFIDNFYSPLNKLMTLYKIRKEMNGLRIVLPEDSEQIAIKEKEYLVAGSLPPNQFANESWFIEIPYVSFYEEDHYEVSNYNDQYFSGGRPFQSITNDIGIVNGSHHVKISFEEIQPTNIYLKLYKEDSSEPDLLLTNDASRQYTKDSDTQKEWELANISVSALNKLIYVDRNIKDYAFAKVDYSIRSYSYFEEGIDLNPFLNSEIKDKKVYFWLNKDLGVVYFVVDSRGFIEEVSNSYYDGWLNKKYKFGNPDVNANFAFKFSLGETLRDSLISERSILLCTIHQPRYLYENDSILTAVQKRSVPELRDSFHHDPKYLPIIDNELRENIWSIPELKNTEIVRIHWTKLKDFVSSELFTKDRLKEEILKLIPSGSQVLIVEDGAIFNMECTEVDLENNRFKIEWIPPIKLNDKISATVYSSSNGETFSALTTIDDIIYQKSHWFTFTSTTLYLKIKVRITRNGSTYFGPESNILKISKGVL